MKASDNVFPKMLLAEGAAPGTPASGQIAVYGKADGKVYAKDDAGTEYDLTATTSGSSIQSLTSASTITPVATNDKVVVTGLTTNTVIANPTGVAAEGQGFVIDIYAAAVYTVGFGSAYAGMDGALTGISTTANKLLKFGVEYSSATGKWMVHKPSVQA